MSDSQAYEEITVASDGVAVTKRYEADEFPVPAIAFNFESDRGEAVTVTLSDDVPDDVAVEDLGFHPEYGSEYWDIDDDEITFEREIEPGADYTTVYGIRATGTDNVEQFLTEPAIEAVDPPLEDDEGALVGDDNDAVKDVISGESDSVPGLDEEEDEDVETLDLKDPNDEGAEAGDGSDGGSGGGDAGGDSGGGGGGVEVTGDSLVNALANELRQNNVSKDDVELLRKAFDLASDDAGSVKARVKKLQQDVSEVIAYADALEEFLDENGTAEEIGDFQSEIEEFRGEIQSFQAELDDLESATSETASTVDSMEEDVQAAKEGADEAQSEAEEVSDTVGDLDDSVDSLEESMDEFESDLDDIRDELGEIREETDEDVEEDLEEINDEIAELKEWREQLSSVIGGGE